MRICGSDGIKYLWWYSPCSNAFDDLFLQIDKDTLNQGQIDNETGQKRFRGLVYERIN